VQAEEATLLERDRELGELDATLALATVGAGRLLAFEGHAGLGKSSLVAAARERAEAAGFRVLRARCSPLEEDFAWGTAIELLEATLSESSAGERARLLGDPDGAVFRLLDRRAEPGGSATPQTVLSIVHGLFWLIADLADGQPLALLVDDAQWCDTPSLRLLLYLLERLDQLPIAVVVAYRPAADGRDPELLARIASHDSSDVRHVEALGLDSVSSLVREVFADATSAFCAACAHRTGGNPFYLHELLLALRAEHDSAAEIENAQVEGMAPRSVSRSVLVRVARLDAGAAALARAVSVLGDRAEFRHAAAVAQLTHDDASRGLDALTDTEILAVGEPLCFVHPLVGTVIYDDIGAAERASLHLRAARLLDSDNADPQRVAAHLLASGPRGDAWAARALQAAAKIALERASPESAARYLDRALSEPPPAALRPALLLALGNAQAMTGQTEDAIRAFDHAVKLLTDPCARAEVRFAHGRALTTQGGHLAAAQAFEAGLAELEDDDTSRLAQEMRVAYVASASLEISLRGHALTALDALEEDSARVPTAGERALLAQHALHAAMAGEPQRRVRDLAERAWGDGALLAGETADGPTWNLLTGALSFSEELAFCESVCDAVLEDARRQGSPMAFATASYCRSYPRFFRGRVSDSLGDVQLALDARSDGWEMFLPSAHAILAWSHIERGELDAARDALALADDPVIHENMGYPWLLEARGRLHLQSGRPKAALDDFLHAGELLVSKLAMPAPGIMPWRSHAARAAMAAGDDEQARVLAEADLALCRHVGAPGMIGRALHTLGVISTNGDGLTLLQEAADTLAGSHVRFEYAHTLVDLGSARRRAGQRTAAREPLRQGHALAHLGGMTALRERARVELAATGARPRKQVLTGLDALTASERRVAGMAAEGQTNRQIAQTLFVTIKAVEAHLHHTYQKLDIDTRKNLSRALERTHSES
jgi:DNA-binding CsgD family transcriptional regulator/predicted negative regulator of RcsB-dependent stress response